MHDRVAWPYLTVQALSASPAGAEPLCGDFASDGKIVALACRDGVARAFNASSGKAVSSFRSERASFGTAACALAFHKGRNVAAVGNTAGEIWYWHVTARRPLMPTPLTQEGSAPAAVTFSPDASYFASASTEGALRLYDANLFVQTALLDGGADSNNCGHSNRAFAVGFVGESATVCVTAGWDGRAVLWDARAGGAVASAHGSHVCGQALDASRGETEVILGSWREADALQVRGTLRMRVVRSAERSQCSDPAQLTPRLARGRYGTSVRGMRRAQ